MSNGVMKLGYGRLSETGRLLPSITPKRSLTWRHDTGPTRSFGLKVRSAASVSHRGVVAEIDDPNNRPTAGVLFARDCDQKIVRRWSLLELRKKQAGVLFKVLKDERPARASRP